MNPTEIADPALPVDARAIRPGDTKLHRIWGFVRFWGIHVVVIAASFWVDLNWTSVILALVLYAVGMFAVTAGYHRYFSHRAFKTSRAFQAVLAWLAVSTMQQGVLWWASHHRMHHKLSDQPGDVHSPRQVGFLTAHVGWFRTHTSTDVKNIGDFLRFPELRWLDRHHALPATVAAALCLIFGGWSGIIVGWGWAALLVWHSTFTINSLCHVWGSQRFDTGDDSRNNPLLALFTFGEGWHNNHHAFQAAARCGFRWWELDITYLILRVLAGLGLVWDLRKPPERFVRG